MTKNILAVKRLEQFNGRRKIQEKLDPRVKANLMAIRGNAASDVIAAVVKVRIGSKRIATLKTASVTAASVTAVSVIAASVTAVSVIAASVTAVSVIAASVTAI